MNTEDSEFERIEREQAMRGIPDAIHHTDTSEPLMYIKGWNDCRQAMLAEQPAQVEVCCGDYGKCMRPCTPRGKWLAEQPKQPLTNEEIKEGRTLRWKDDPNEAPEPWSFRMGVEWAEEKHGITKGNT